MLLTPRLVIQYCPRCGWLLRAAWLAQEALSTFSEELAEVALQPAAAGVFAIFLDETQIWCRVADGGFPEAKVLKQRIRDCIAPERNLGHNENK